MKIKKFPQSCILIETAGKKILVDPGTVKYEQTFLKDWKTADAILITHRHSDHINADILKTLNIPIYSTNEVKKYNPDLSINIIKQGDNFKIGNIKIEVTKAIHGFTTVDAEIFENVGFIIDNGKAKLYITSDTLRFNYPYKADFLFADITAYDVSMNLWGAMMTYKEVGAKLLIVAHQDKGMMLYEKEQIEKYFSEQKINFIIPQIGDELELK